MSQTFKFTSIVRCPLCHDGKTPQHIGHGVLFCECCGNRFRVVHANPGRTGKRLEAEIDKKMVFPSGP